MNITYKNHIFILKKNYHFHSININIVIPELLSQFVEQEVIKRNYKNKLVGYVLNGYLSLRKLVVQRTKLIDDTQDKLLELLEELTTGKFTFICCFEPEVVSGHICVVLGFLAISLKLL